MDFQPQHTSLPSSTPSLKAGASLGSDGDTVEDFGILDFEEDGNCSESEDDSWLPRSCKWHDRFHIFQAFPSSKDPKISAQMKIGRRMALQALTEFDADNFEGVKKYLGRKKRIYGMENVIDHFYFKREWWYRRVRVYPPEAQKSVRNLTVVANTVQEDKELKVIWPHVRAWFKKTIELCCRRKLEESYDCMMYQWDSRDRNGLDLYIRFRASN